MDHPLHKYFSARHDALVALDQCAIQTHNGEKGRMRELLVNEFLLAHIPKSLHIGSGQIIGHKWCDGGDEISTQQDMVIYRQDMPSLTVSGAQTFFVESVLATIEIKTNYKNSDLPDIFAAAKSVKRIMPVPTVVFKFAPNEATDRAWESGHRGNGRPRRILHGVVYFHGPAERKSIVGRLNEEYHKQGSWGPDFLYSLESGLIIRSGEIDVLRSPDDATSLSMDDVTSGLSDEEMGAGAYRRAFRQRECWRGLEILIFELAERCQKHFATYAPMLPYVSGT